MKIRRYFIAPLLILAMFSTACTDDNLKKLAQAGDDFSRGITVALDLDAAMLHSGTISRDDALVVTTSLLDLNKLGKRFHERLTVYSKLTPEARGELLPLVNGLVDDADKLQRDGLLRIKNPQSQAEFNAAIGIVKSALATARAVLKGK